MRKEEFKMLYEKFLNNSCNEEEMEELQRYFSQMDDAEDLEEVESLINRSSLDIKLSAEKSDRILQNILYPKEKRNFFRTIAPYLKYVAAACLLIVAFVTIRQRHVSSLGSATEVVFKNDTNTTKKLLLQDGTYVYLRAQGEIIQSTNFNTDTVRRIHLTGEAFFAVAPDETKPFVVHADDHFVVRVLGTRFNMKSTADAREVVLTEGSVVLVNDQNQLKLRPLQRAVYSEAIDGFHTSTVDTLFYTSWIRNQLYFEDEKLENVINQLNKNYTYEEQRLKTSTSAGDLQFTGSLPTNNLDKCLQILNKTFANHHIIITTE